VDDASLAEARRRWAPTFAPRRPPRVAVLLGGPTRHCAYAPEALAAHVLACVNSARQQWDDRWLQPVEVSMASFSPGKLERTLTSHDGLTMKGSVSVTTSARTPPAMTAVVQAAAAKGDCTLWQWGSDDAATNPLYGMLATADVVIVTGDSVSMVSEAAAARRPLFLAAGEAATGKLRTFHSSLVAAGVARMLRCPEDVRAQALLSPSIFWGSTIAAISLDECCNSFCRRGNHGISTTTCVMWHALSRGVYARRVGHCLIDCDNQYGCLSCFYLLSSHITANALPYCHDDGALIRR
jgi:mitochondrial fission protein ELM1